jgi:hypothetical protein
MTTRPQPQRRPERRRLVIEPGQRYFLTDKEAADLAAKQERDPRRD